MPHLVSKKIYPRSPLNTIVARPVPWLLYQTSPDTRPYAAITRRRLGQEDRSRAYSPRETHRVDPDGGVDIRVGRPIRAAHCAPTESPPRHIYAVALVGPGLTHHYSKRHARSIAGYPGPEL